MLPDFVMRPAATADLEDIVALINNSSLHTRATPAVRTGQVKGWLHWFGKRLATDTCLALLDGSKVVGYAHVVSEAPHLVTEVRTAVDPAYRHISIGSSLLGWAEQRAYELLPQAPGGSRVVMHHNLFTGDRIGEALLRAVGYEPVRHFIHLRIDMTAPPPEAVWPAGITVRTVTAADWSQLTAALDEAFQDHWGIVEEIASHEYPVDEEPAVSPEERSEEDKAYFNTPGLCFVALEGDEVVASCLCNAKTVEFPETGKLGSLSVRRPWRRRGIGLALTLHALGEFYRQGICSVITDTDRESFTGANRLYPRAGMTVFAEEAIYEKEIRPGRDFLKRLPNR